MATPFRLKRSAVSGKRPSLNDLQLGELALNTYDGYLFAERDTAGVGIGTTIALLTPWTENFGGGSIYYSNSVGIGTALPTAKLDVNGTLNVVGVSTFKDKVILDSTNSIQIPVGNTSERDPSPVAGQIRYNSELSSFEGYGPGNAWGSLGGVKDVDGDTYIKPETSAGSDEDTLYFYNAGSNTATISSTTASINVDFSVAGAARFDQDVEVAGNLTVNGTQTILNTNILEVEDINIGIASADPKLSNSALDGAGITIHGAAGDKTLTWSNANSRMEFNTDLYAPNIVSTDLTLSGDLDVDGHTELDNVNISGIVTAYELNVEGHTELDNVNISGIVTAYELDVDGHTELDNVNISGIVTAYELDVDGHTELDNVNISGVTTFGSYLDINSFVDIFGPINVGGISTFTGIGTFVSDLYVGGDLYVADDLVFDEFTARNAVLTGNLQVAGVSTFNGNVDVDGHTELDNVNISGIVTAYELDVDGHTELDNVNISGVTTFAGNIDANGNLNLLGNLDVDGHTELDNLRVSGVSTFTSSVNINADIDVDGHTELDNVNISGIVTAFDLDVDGHTELDNLRVSGVTTFAGNIDANGNLDLLGNLDVDGHTELDNLRVSGVSTFQSNVYLGDNDVLNFGANNDLQIFSNGSASSIKETGSGNLQILGDSILFTDAGNNKFYAKYLSTNGSVELYYDNSKKFETTGIGISISNGGTDTATIAGPENIIIDPAAVGDNTGLVRIKGDLYVDGTTTQINSTTIELADFIVGIATTATTDILADGAGIQIGPDNTFLYEYNGGTNSSLKSSENLNVASGKVYQIDQTERLSANTLSLGTGTTIHSSTSNVLSLGVAGGEKLKVSNSNVIVYENLGVKVTPASNTQVAIAGTLGISEVGGSGARTLFTSSGNGFYLNHNDNSNINFQSQGSNKLSYNLSSDSWVIPGTTETKLLVGTGATTGIANQRLQVTGGAYISGDVGIGLTNPSEKLHVSGKVKINNGNAVDALDMSNGGIVGVHSLSFNDPGPDEGITWSGGNGWSIYESPNDLTTNSAGNLQFVNSGSRVFTLDTSGNGEFTGDVTVDQLITNNNGNSQNVRIGDDVWLGDMNLANTLRIRGQQDETQGYIVFGTSNATKLGRSGTGPLNYGGDFTVNGNLGIGSTQPAAKLDVTGDTNVTGYQYRGDSVKTASLFVRGTGLNNLSNRHVYLNGTRIVNTNTRGLTLTVIGAGLTHVSSTNYDTFGDADKATDLAAAIANINVGEIGVLSSFDAWEGQVNDGLRSAALKVGLTKLGTYSGGGSRRPYAAVFYGTSDDIDARPRDVIERMESSDADAPEASIFCNLATETVAGSVSIPGAVSVNALYSSQSTTQGPVVVVDSADNVGVGTLAPSEKLDVRGNINVNDISVTGTATASLTTLTETPIHTALSASTYRSVEYTIQATQGSNYHSTKVLVVHDGSSAYHNEYGTVYNNSSVATFNADISGGNIRLLATGASSSSTVYKVYFVATKV